MSGIALKFNLLWDAFLFLGKNSRVPNKANHGSRPCSHIGRRLRAKSILIKSRKFYKT